jgi:hypothetical protein
MGLNTIDLTHLTTEDMQAAERAYFGKPQVPAPISQGMIEAPREGSELYSRGFIPLETLDEVRAAYREFFGPDTPDNEFSRRWFRDCLPAKPDA